MVARIIQLRVAILTSVFRGGPRLVVRHLVFAAAAIAAAVSYAWLPEWLGSGPADRAPIDIFLSSVVLAGVAFVPLFARVGNLEPRQFATFPITPSSLAWTLGATTVLTWPALLMALWLAVLVFLRPEWLAVGWELPVALVLAFLLALVFARVSSSFVALVVPQRAVSALRWIGLLLLIAALPVIVFMLTDVLRSPRNSAILESANIFAWTPFGAPFAAIAAAEVGESTAALGYLGVAAGSLVLLLTLWHILVQRSLTTIERPTPAGVTRDGLELFERFSAKPRAVIAARSLTYWRRDPRYRVALFAIPVAPIVMFAALWIAGVDPQLLTLLPLPVILLLLGWSLHNDVALDSTAIWMHVASGTKGSHDRAGRLAPVLLVGLPLAVIGSSITVTIGGDWRILPAVVGMNLAVLAVAAGVSSVFSALMPYPATRPGDSPFAQPAVQGSGAGLSQTLSMLLALILVLPPVLVSVSAIIDLTFTLNVIALGFGVAWGALVLWVGVFAGGRVFDRSAPELIAVTQTFD